MPTQATPHDSPAVVSSATSPPPEVSPVLGPPEILPTQPFSPGRGLLSAGRTHATGDGRAASLPPPAPLRDAFAAAVGAQLPRGDAGAAGRDAVSGGGGGEGGSKAAARQKEDKDL
eukprot:15440818-Alexandrium_andersonii.AAC.1